MKRKLVYILALLLLLSYIVYKVLYKPHRDINAEDSVYTITAIQIAEDFERNENDASQKYLNNTITLSGMVTDTKKGLVVLEDKVFFILQDSTLLLKVNNKAIIKGRCIGYDELLGEIKVDQAFPQ